MVKTAGYSTRVATDAPHGGNIYASPLDFTAAMYDYTASAAWLTATPYVVGDVRKHGAAGYRSILNHTSGATTEPGVGAAWTTAWEVLGANVLLLSSLPGDLSTLDISCFSRVLVYPSGHSPALPYIPVEDPKMRWDNTNKLLWLPDDVAAGDVLRVEIEGLSLYSLISIISSFNPTNDKVGAQPIPAVEIVDAGKFVCSGTVGTSVAVTTTSKKCRAVIISPTPALVIAAGGDYWFYGINSDATVNAIIDASGNPMKGDFRCYKGWYIDATPKIVYHAMGIAIIDIDNASKLRVACSQASKEGFYSAIGV